MSLSVNQKLYALLENHIGTPDREQKIQACIAEGLDFTDPELTYQVVTQDKISNCCFKYLLAAPEACFHTQTRTGRNRGETAIHALSRYPGRISYLKDILQRYDRLFETIQSCLPTLPQVLHQLIDSYLGSKKDALQIQSDKSQTPLHVAMFSRNHPSAELLAPNTNLDLLWDPSRLDWSLRHELEIFRGREKIHWYLLRYEELEAEWQRNRETRFTPIDHNKIADQASKETYEKFPVIRS